MKIEPVPGGGEAILRAVQGPWDDVSGMNVSKKSLSSHLGTTPEKMQQDTTETTLVQGTLGTRFQAYG